MIQQQGSERPTTSGSYKSEQDTTIRVHAVDAALLSRSSCVSQPKPTMHPHSWHPVPSPTTSASPPLAHPQRSIAQYSQKVELYRGSVSTVYKALDDVTGTKVILKCYHKKKMQAKHYNKLDREIMAMVALRGPFVAELTRWFQDEDSVWLAMELCEGGDLFKSLMLHGGRLDEHYVCTEIIAPLLRVLEKSHAMNIMHRDIKPENLFLTRYQKIRVGDFGLAVDWSKELPFSRSGTLDYMAPEVLRNPASQLQESSDVTLEQLQAKGIKPYDEKVDVWAVGVLAYEMVVGKPPFEVEDEAQTANLIMTSNAITFPSTHSSLWADFVRCVLVKDPQQRPSAAQLMHHPWIVSQINRALAAASAQGRVSSKEVLLQAFPLQPQALQLMQQARHTPWIMPPGSQPQPQAPSPAPASAPPPTNSPTWAGKQQPPTQPCLHTDQPQVKATTPTCFVSPPPTQQQQQWQQQQQCLPQPISHELHTPTRPSQAAPVPATAPAHGGMSAPHSSSPWSSCRSYSSPTIAATQAAPQQPQQKTGCTATPVIERSSASAMSMTFVDRCRSCMPASRPPLQHSSSSNSSSSSSGLVSAASSFGHAAAAIAAAAETPGLDRNSNSSAEGAQAGRAVPHGLPRPPAAAPSLSAAQMSSLLQAYDQGTASLQQLLGAVGHSHATAAVRVHGRTGSARSDKQETASTDAAQSSSAAEDTLALGMGQLRVAPGLPDAVDSNVHDQGSDQQRCPQSPAPMAGFKQRSVFHLQRQAWPSSYLGRS